MFKKICLIGIASLLLGLSSQSMAQYCPSGQNVVSNCNDFLVNSESACNSYHVSTGAQSTQVCCTIVGTCAPFGSDCDCSLPGCNVYNVNTGYDNGYWCTVSGVGGASPCTQGPIACQ